MTFFKMAVVVDQHQGFKPFVRSQRCKLQSFTHLECAMVQLSQTNLTNSLKRAINDVSIFHRSFSTPCLSVASKMDKEFDVCPRIEIVGGRGVPRVRALVAEVSISMASGINPILVSSGLGGAYLFSSKNGENIAVAKPIDEEPMACNNPKGFAGRMLGQPGLKRSIRVGETAVRELAAYLLDHGEFAGVPETALVKFSRVAFHVNDTETPTTKIASLQRYVEHEYDAGELGPSGFSVGSVHRIGILDVRLLNLDRHAGNILVKKGEHKTYAVELVPIDHGLCLPEWLDDPYFEWLHWPQASLPFSESEADYISKLDPFNDAKLLRSELPYLRESSIRVLVLCTIFLQRAVAAGFCLADIGEMMTRESCGGEEDLSALENICEEAKARSRLGNHVQSEEDEDDEDDDEDENEDEDDERDEDDDDETGMFEFDDDRSKLSELVAESTELPLDALLYALVEEADEEESSCKLGRSMSFSAQKHRCNESKDGVCFDEMSEDEWHFFLENFEKLLPDFFEDTKNLNSKQRLGTSCKF